MPSEEPDLEVVRQILSYFLRNPEAADSLEGVARWRLLEEQVHRSVQQTEAALKWLVSQGYLEEVEVAGSTQIFRLSSKHRNDAAKLVGKPAKKKSR